LLAEDAKVGEVYELFKHQKSYIYKLTTKESEHSCCETRNDHVRILSFIFNTPYCVHVYIKIRTDTSACVLLLNNQLGKK
jgi:hypothetical protein